MTILAIDFTGIGAAQSFGTLLPPDAIAVDPIKQHFGGRVSLAELAALIAAGLPEPPTHVFGYCAGALLAAAIAETRPGTGVVLFDPDPVTRAQLREDFDTLYAGLGGDPARVEGGLAEFEVALLECRDRLAEDSGGDETAAELAGYLLDRHCAWLRFLDASSTAGPAAPSGPVSVITGRPRLSLDGIVAGPARPEVFRCTAGQGSVLAHPDAPGLLRTALHR